MFDTFDGLPLHPLVVHAVVVLLPLAVVGAVALVLRPVWREKYGWLVIGVTAIATVLIPVATSSGEELEKRVGNPGDHARLGDQLIWFAIPLLVLTIVWVLLGRVTTARVATADRPDTVDSVDSGGAAYSARATKPRLPAALTWGVAVLTLFAAVSTGVQVYKVGETGARAAWGGVVRN